MLHELLGDELAPQVQAKIGDDYMIVKKADYVPKVRLSELSDQKKELQTINSDLSSKIEELSSSVSSAEELKSQIAQLTESNKNTISNFDKKIEFIKLGYEVESEMKDFGVKNSKAVKALIDMDKVSLNDKGIIGLKEQLEGVRESDPYLFKDTKQAPPTTATGGTHTTPTAENPFKTGNVMEQMKLAKTDPTRFEKLKSEFYTT